MFHLNAPIRAARASAAALLTVAALGLTGAAHAGNYDAVLGAGVGAAAGAIIGQQVGGRQGAVIGGATGAVIGATVGNNANHGGGHDAGPVVQPTRGYYPPQRPAQVMVVNDDYRHPEPRHWGWRHHGDHRDFRREEYRHEHDRDWDRR
jgi:uncharacterized protein YcfJ